MKTPDCWLTAFPPSNTGSSGQPICALLNRAQIEAIQADARDGMVSKDELRPTIELLTRLVGHYYEPQIAHYRIVNEIARLQNLLGEKGEGRIG